MAVEQSCLTQCIDEMVYVQSFYPQIRQLNLITRNSKDQVDDLVGELPLAKPSD